MEACAMNIYTVDSETYFDDAYTLKKLSTEAYVRDARFEVHGWAVRFPDGKLEWLGAQDFASAEWKKELSAAATLGHHQQFDGLILSHHYGIVPAAYLDTLSMARLLLGNHVSVSLDSVRSHFGMVPKRTPYHLFKGAHWHELTNGERAEVAAGAVDEVQSIWKIFNRFMAGNY